MKLKIHKLLIIRNIVVYSILKKYSTLRIYAQTMTQIRYNYDTTMRNYETLFRTYKNFLFQSVILNIDIWG